MPRSNRSFQDMIRGSGSSTAEQGPFPWALAILVLIVLMAVGYSLDHDKSLSERKGVVSQSEAENGVIPSLPPE